MNPKFAAEFVNPPSQYRGAPFWAWNGRLEPEELRRQIRILHRMGLGGFFMHSRVGLNTPYMGDKWMQCVAACIDEAEKLDMQAWLYDEDRWPSGAAGGLVTRNPKYRQRHMIMKVLAQPADLAWTKDVLAAFTATLGEGTASGLTRLARGSRPKSLAKGQSILVFSQVAAECNSWYNGYTYLDTMSRQAVAEFIRVTHQAYRKKFGQEFGKRVPGIFTDEPNYGNHRGSVFYGETAERVPWTPSIPKDFRRRFGCDLADLLPELFLVVDGKVDSRVRWQFHELITSLFVDSFSRQIGRWCDRAGLEFTGHALMEGNLGSQTDVVGSCMRFYEYMQAPGMDLLTEHSREYDTAKQVSSAARQFGRKWRLTETYGCTGWDFNFAGHKALGDWQAALGINLRCQHLSWYTMLGEAKRDYPAGIFYQSPWWTYYRKVEDYFARIHVAMTRGKEIRDVLVIHPVESMWMIYAKAAKAEQDALQNGFWRLRDTLLAANLDFDYGDEDLAARHGSVRKTADGPVLKIAKAEYRVAVVPPMRTIRRSTLTLLQKFREAGGTVVFAGPPPELVNAQPSHAAKRLAAACTRAPARGEKLAAAVEPAGRRVSITDPKGRQIVPTLYCLREDAEALFLFVANTGHDHFGRKQEDPMVRDRTLAFDDVRVSVAADTRAAPVELDCETGRTLATDARRAGEGWEIRTSFPAIGSRLFVLPKKALRGKVHQRRTETTLATRTLSPRTWAVQLSEPNVLVLDYPQFKIAGGSWQKADDVLFIDRAVRQSLGIPLRGGHMAQPWTRQAPEHPRSTTVALRYTFHVAALPSGSLSLALERPDTFDIRLNGGQPLDTDTECGWWVDTSLRTVVLDPADLRLGANTLDLACRYDETHPGLEMIYLLGAFGATVKGLDVTMTAAPAALRLGDWTRQGLPFYSGSVCYTTTLRPKLAKGRRLVVQVSDFRGTAVRVLVNGQEAGLIAWPPYELDITDAVASVVGARHVVPGRSRATPSLTLGIEILGHRRNSHGPMHLNEKWPHWTGPGQYAPGEHQLTDRYQLVPCGLMRAPKLVVRK